ncbi:MAG: response regulator [Pseudomonadota bacterium]
MSKRVVIVEDEAVIAASIEMTLVDAGHNVLGVAHSVEDALKILDEYEADFVTLDYDLGTETTETIAELLFEKNIAFAWVSGNIDTVAKLQASKPVALISKPFAEKELVDALRRA